MKLSDIKKMVDEELKYVLENINDPALKALRTRIPGEKFPNLKQWWEYEPEDIMTYVYWHQGQLPPSDKVKFEKVTGKSSNAEAKIAGITPAVLIFKGK